MAMEMRQELKLSQQLVMTPQLQQAIRLLQLSRMELAELVHDEMLENPILDDEMDLDTERSQRARGGWQRDRGRCWLRWSRCRDSTESPDRRLGWWHGLAQTEIKARRRRRSTRSTGRTTSTTTRWPRRCRRSAATARRCRRSKQTLTKPTLSLHDHLAWQLKLSSLPPEPSSRSASPSSATSTPTATSRTRRSRSSPRTWGSTDELCEMVLEKIQTFDPTGIGARNLAECMLIQAIARRVRTTTWSSR
jgi:RNA polymerase sigma-54 factor